MTITCKVTPSQAATGVTLHIVPKGSPDDIFCTNGHYQADTSDCEAGDWKWGSFVIEAPDVVAAIFGGITSMQEMTPEICAAAKEGDTVRLRDSRDDKMYWVAKLADGNCWMTQNLDLDLNTVGTLTPENSDVSTDWNFNNTGGGWYNVVNQGSNDNTAIQGWDLGEYVKTSPTDTTSCGYITTGDLSACPDQFTSVSGMTSFTEAINEEQTPNNNVAVIGGQYDAHFLVGNYYSWPAATAGSGNNVGRFGGYAADSICPAGWRLPDSNGSSSETASFSNLLSQYGLTSTPTSGNNNIATSPLYFVRSGSVLPSSNLYAGSEGSYWSGHASPSFSYGLYFTSSDIEPSHIDDRRLGYSVRCVADWE